MRGHAAIRIHVREIQLTARLQQLVRGGEDGGLVRHQIDDAVRYDDVEAAFLQPQLIELLDIAFDEADVHEFYARIRRFLSLAENEPVALVGEPKIDGLSVSVRYERGKFTLGATRGDGLEGENVSANLKTVASLPQTLKGKTPDVLVVRGEVYMSKEAFAALNERQAEADGKIYAINQSADTFILKASSKFELLATNSLGEMTQSSIAVSDGELFIRTYEHLWCISNEK